MSNALEAVKNAPLRQVKSVKDLLWNEQAKQQLAMVAARHMSAERLMRVTANAIRTTPALQECDPMSFLGALMQSAALGLEANTVLGHAYLIPFRNNRKGITECQMVIGYRGLIDLARRSGHIVSINAGIHYSDDETTGGLWEYEEGTESRLRHRNGDMNGKKLHAYAIAKLKDGGHAYVVLPWSHVMRIRDASQGYQTAIRYNKKDTPWIAHEDAMAKKTAIRALAKYLPLSVEFVDALSIDEKRADYRAFAMDPASGIAPVEEDFIEGEAEETAAPAKIEADTAPDPVQEQMKKPEPEKQAAKPAPRAEPRPKAEAKPAAPDESQYRALLDMMLADLAQSGPEETLQVYAPQIEQMRASAPNVYAEWHKAVVAAKRQPVPEQAFEQSEPEAEKAPAAIDPYANPLGKTFLKDCADMGFNAAMDFHSDAMDSLKARNIELWEAIMAEARKIDPMA